MLKTITTLVALETSFIEQNSCVTFLIYLISDTLLYKVVTHEHEK